MTNWAHHYEIGDSRLDEHHRELFDLTTMLDTAITSNNPQKLNDIIEFLEHYAVDHFSEEEEFMKKHEYNGLKHHQHEHQKLTTLIQHLRYIYENKHPSSHIIFEIRKLIDTLTNHIQTVDIDIAKLIKEEDQ